MILDARPRTSAPGIGKGSRSAAQPARSATLQRPVLQHSRSPQQLCLDLRQR
jgi:hypothetical protein